MEVVELFSGFTGKDKQFRKIYSDNYAVIFNMIRRRVDNLHDAEEICHDLFIAMYKKFDQIDDCGKWLRASVRFEVLNYIRAKKNQPNMSIDDVDETDIPSKVSSDRDLMIIVKEVISDVSNFDDEQQQIIFHLIAIYRYTYAEAATELGITRRQAEYGYGKAALKISEILKRDGITSEEVL